MIDSFIEPPPDEPPEQPGQNADRSKKSLHRLETLEVQVRQLEEALAAKGDYIGLLHQHSCRDTASEFNWQAMSLHRHDIIQRMQALIHEKDSLLREKDALILEQESYIQAVGKSLSWKITRPLRYLHSWLHPEPVSSCHPLAPSETEGEETVESDIRPEPEPVPDGGPGKEYAEWFSTYGHPDSQQLNDIKQYLADKGSTPSFRILIRIQTPKEMKALQATLQSLHGQLFSQWTVTVFAPPALQSGIPRNGSVTLQSCDEDPDDAARGIQPAQNADPETFLMWLRPGDRLVPHALLLFASGIVDTENTELVYADEDRITETGEGTDPFFKPDWNPDYAASVNYIGRAAAWRATTVARAGGARGFLSGFDNWDLLLRIRPELSRETVQHMPFILMHTPPGAEPSYEQSGKSIQNILQDEMERNDGAACEPIPSFPYWRVRHPVPTPCPKVSILLPTRNGYYLLRRCIDSIFEKTTYPDFEIVIIDHQSDEPTSLEYLEAVSGLRNVQVLRHTGVFNFSDIINRGAQHASGDIFLLLNNDTEVITPDWLDELAAQAMRPGIGAVGPLLLHHSGAIQHAGVFLGAGGTIAGNALGGCSPDRTIQRQRFRHVQNVSAVTGACLAVRRNVFEEVGGLDAENLAVTFNDVDLCLRIQARGYRNVWTPHAVLYHEESSSRGIDDTPDKIKRFLSEEAFMKQQWGDLLPRDPAYNPNLCLKTVRMGLAWPPRHLSQPIP